MHGRKHNKCNHKITCNIKFDLASTDYIQYISDANNYLTINFKHFHP